MNTLFIGQNIIHLKSVDSTNSYASELLRQNSIPEGTLIYTGEQTNGRGQRGNVWESEPNKNISLSLVLYPKFLSTEKQFLLTKITSLAVADLMAEVLTSTEKIKIKWPNDIYIDDKKIGGILIENSIRDSNLQSAVIGIGINVNQTVFKTKKNVTSLALITNKRFDLMELMEKLCEFFEARYLQLRANKLEAIDFDYLRRLYRFNIWTNFISKDITFEGKIIGVSVSGKLQILLKSEETKEFDLKEILFI